LTWHYNNLAAQIKSKARNLLVTHRIGQPGQTGEIQCVTGLPIHEAQATTGMAGQGVPRPACAVI